MDRCVLLEKSCSISMDQTQTGLHLAVCANSKLHFSCSDDQLTYLATKMILSQPV